jgi:hypothetical protein
VTFQENKKFNLQIQGTLFILEFFKASCIKFSACTASRKKEKEKKINDGRTSR